MMGKVIECIWPRLKGDPTVYDGFLDEDSPIPDSHLDISIEFATLMYEKQAQRIATIESKSSIYLGFFGTVVAILAFALKDILFQKQNGFTYDLALIFGGVLIIYILQVMRYSIKALERRTYHSFNESDFLHGDKRKTVIVLINKIKKNYDVINSKVDYMTMAHEFTKRILWIILIAAIALVALPAFSYILLIPDIELPALPLEFSLRWSDYLLAPVIVVLITNQYRLRKIKKKLKE